MTLIAIAVILFSTILLILCLPVTYEIKVHIGPPFHLAFSAGWGRQLIRKSWSYTVGEEFKDELYILGKKDSPPPEKESTPIEESQEKPLQDAAEEIKKAADLRKISKKKSKRPLNKRLKKNLTRKAIRKPILKRRRAAPESGFPSSSTPTSWPPFSLGCPASSATVKFVTCPYAES